MSLSEIIIRRYQAGDSDGIVNVIVPIQVAEFGIAITAEQQPDLRDIEAFYQRGSGDFWVAEHAGDIVGCIALKDIGDGQCALRKMFVAAAYRGRDYGIAARLLSALLEHARRSGVQDIFLGTTAQFLAAHRFYEKHGFQEVAVETLPSSFPIMKVDSKFYHWSFYA
ncbi:GNAT family N-acetyltransferase [Enterobacterales bacterium CwR94]|nr:GNAT family N-acetyltransferase [Enterobacterales bacterium CwR94]